MKQNKEKTTPKTEPQLFHSVISSARTNSTTVYRYIKKKIRETFPPLPQRANQILFPPHKANTDAILRVNTQTLESLFNIFHFFPPFFLFVATTYSRTFPA